MALSDILKTAAKGAVMANPLYNSLYPLINGTNAVKGIMSGKNTQPLPSVQKTVAAPVQQSPVLTNQKASSQPAQPTVTPTVTPTLTNNPQQSSIQTPQTPQTPNANEMFNKILEAQYKAALSFKSTGNPDQDIQSKIQAIQQARDNIDINTPLAQDLALTPGAQARSREIQRSGYDDQINTLVNAVKNRQLTRKEEQDATQNLLKLLIEKQNADNANNFTLGEGQVRYDQNGKVIATGNPKPGGNEKIVKINGVDYVQNADGTFSNPNVPEASKQASELKTSALQSAKDLLQKFDAGNTFAVGGSSVVPIIPGTKASDFKVQFDNLKSQLSLDNVKLLKGQGAVSDAERALLDRASSKLNLAQSEPEFRAALQDIITGLSGSNTSQGTVSKDDLKLQFPQATPQEIDALYQEEVGKTSDLGKSLNLAAVTPTGSVGGQCGNFSRKLVDYPHGLGDQLSEKMAFVDKVGMPANEWQQNPKVGDVLITAESKKTGHVAVVNAVLPNGKVRLTESNFNNDLLVNNKRELAINSSVIYGAVRGKLKV